MKAHLSHVHGLYGTSLKCSFVLVAVGGLRVSFTLCEFKCVLFFASNIDDMKSTINRRAGVQLLSHARQNCVSVSLILGIRKHL